MRICTIANGSCFMELGLDTDSKVNNYYGGNSTPTREVFNALSEIQGTLLAISYGKQLRTGSKNDHQLIEIPIIEGVGSIVRRLLLKITKNFLPVIQKLLSFNPDYVISIDAWTFRHLIPMLYCFISSNKLIFVFTAQYSGCIGNSVFRRILVKILIHSTKMNFVHTVGARSYAVLFQLRDAGVDDTKLRVMHPCFRGYATSPDREIEHEEHYRFSVLYIGRLVEEKSPLIFIEIALRLSKSIGSQNIKFAIIGDGPLKDEMRKRIADLNIQDSVNMLGYLNPKEIFSYLQKSDLLIIPSRCESFGKVAVEAMIAGTPVVASRVGGLTDIIVDGENGFLCDYGSVSDFVDQVTMLYENPSLQRKFAGSINKYREFWLKQESSFKRLVRDVSTE